MTNYIVSHNILSTMDATRREGARGPRTASTGASPAARRYLLALLGLEEGGHAPVRRSAIAEALSVRSSSVCAMLGRLRQSGHVPGSDGTAARLTTLGRSLAVASQDAEDLLTIAFRRTLGLSGAKARAEGALLAPHLSPELTRHLRMTAFPRGSVAKDPIAEREAGTDSAEVDARVDQPAGRAAVHGHPHIGVDAR